MTAAVFEKARPSFPAPLRERALYRDRRPRLPARTSRENRPPPFAGTYLAAYESRNFL